MKKNIFRIFITSMVFVTIALPLRPNVCRAEKISDYDLIMKLEYSCYQGMITSVSSAGDYLVLSSQKRICLSMSPIREASSSRQSTVVTMTSLMQPD